MRISRDLASMVYSITKIFVDITPFAIVFGVIIFCFADAFSSLSNTNETPIFTGGFVYAF